MGRSSTGSLRSELLSEAKRFAKQTAERSEQRWFGIPYFSRLGNQILSILKQVGIWIRSKFYVELHRGQIAVTTRILSPAARHENGVPSSKAGLKHLRTQAKLREIIIAASRGELPTTSPFVYATEIRGYAAQFALLEEGIVYYLRVPRWKAYKAVMSGIVFA